MNRLAEKGKEIYQRFIDNVGKKNYEKLLKENPKEYDIGYNSPETIKQLIKDAKDKKANVYKGYNIPMQYKNKTWNEYLKNNHTSKYNDYDNRNIEAMTLYLGRKSINEKDIGKLNKLDNPSIIYLKPMLNKPAAMNKFILGHEIGHSKNIYDKQSLLPRIKTAQKDNNINKTKKLIKQYEKIKNKDNKINSINDKIIHLREELADKNVSKFLKQMKVPKKDRQAIYYMKKNLYPHQGMRYKTKFGDLKYLKDYIFGFSNLPNDYGLYKPMTQEWKDLMREHFYDIYFSNRYKLFHISNKGNLNILYPKIPNNYFTSIGYERNDIARISFSTSIYGCLRGLSNNIQNKKYFVYTPIGEYKIITPKKSEVPDIKYTDEKWILEPVRVKCIGQIIVSYPQKNHPLNYRYGQQNATLYGWNYRWLFKD